MIKSLFAFFTLLLHGIGIAAASDMPAINFTAGERIANVKVHEYISPVVRGDDVFVVTKGGAVQSIDRNDLQSKWIMQLHHADYQSADIFIDGDMILVIFGNVLYALNAQTGTMLWRREVRSSIIGKPVIADSYIFLLTADNYVYALNKNDSSPLWGYQGPLAEVRIMSDAVPVYSAERNVLIVPFSNGEVYELDVKNGYKIWSYKFTGDLVKQPMVKANFSPLLTENGVVAGTAFGIASLDIQSGVKRWYRRFNVKGITKINGNMLFGLSIDNEIIALDVKDGRVIWTYNLSKQSKITLSSKDEWLHPFLFEDRLWVMSSAGHLVEIQPKDGEIIAVHNTFKGARSVPSSYESSLYFTTPKGVAILSR